VAARRGILGSLGAAALIAAAAGAAAASGPAGRLMAPGELRVPGFAVQGAPTTSGIAYFEADTCTPRERATVARLTSEGFQQVSRRFFTSRSGGADSLVLRFRTAAGARRAMADALVQPVACAGSVYRNTGSIRVPGVTGARGVLRSITVQGDPYAPAGRGALIVLARGRVLYQTGIEQYDPSAASPGPLLAAAAGRWLRRVT